MSSSGAVATSRRSDNTATYLCVALALVVLGLGVLTQPTVGWSAALIASFYGLSLALGASLFAAINAVTGARWCTPLGLAPSIVGRTLLVPALGIAITLLFGLFAIYPWAAPVAETHLLHEKLAWLNAPFFLARAGIVLIIMLALTGSLFKHSAAQPGRRIGALFIVIFAICISVASWDWMMSLEPEWFSTMYGVYGFAGSFLGGIALVTVVAAALSNEKVARVRLETRQVHDLGSLLFGFSMFWAYIWFCQYMLIWYANLPEETGYFARRLSHGWAVLFWLNLILNFVVPFLVLLSSRAKRHMPTVVQVAVVILAGRWLDTYLMVAPSTSEAPEFPAYAIAATVVVGMVMIMFGKRLVERTNA